MKLGVWKIRVTVLNTSVSIIISTCEQNLLHRGHAFFSTAANNATDTKQIGAGKPIQKDPVKKGASEEQIADMRILRTLAKYLWLKDNFEFRFRVLIALGLLVGAKVRS